jgi:hypothetical protein
VDGIQTRDAQDEKKGARSAGGARVRKSIKGGTKLSEAEEREIRHSVETIEGFQSANAIYIGLHRQVALLLREIDHLRGLNAYHLDLLKATANLLTTHDVAGRCLAGIVKEWEQNVREDRDYSFYLDEAGEKREAREGEG